MRLDVSGTTLEYEDSAGPDSGSSLPTLVLLHGVHMTSSLWNQVVADLQQDHRCVRPTLPLGGHRIPVPPERDLNLPGLARLVGEFLDALDLRDAILVGNDTGGAVLQVLAAQEPDRIAGLVLVSCEAFDNMPPGLPGRADQLTALLPGGPRLAAQTLRLPGSGRLPFTFGRLAARPVPPTLIEQWFAPLRHDPAIRRDFRRMVRALDARDLQDAAERLPHFSGRAAVVWAGDERVMPAAHGPALARLLDAPLTVVEDSRTLIPLDQPAALAATIRDFAHPQAARPAGRTGVRNAVDLSAGTIEYLDTGGDGPVVVLTHGLLMDADLWGDVVDRLAPELRCIAPTFPIGSHRLPMRRDADLTQQGLVALLGEFLDALELQDVTLVVNDLGYPLGLAAGNHPRLGGLVLTPCEAFDNVPPGLPGAVVGSAARVPGGLWLAALGLLVPGVARLPLTLGRMSRRPVPRRLLRAWTRPARRDRAVRRDLRRYIRLATAAWQQATTESLRGFRGRSLVVWAREDRVMPPEHGRRLQQLLPGARLVELDDCRTLVPLDAPDALAREIRAFVAVGGP